MAQFLIGFVTIFLFFALLVSLQGILPDIPTEFYDALTTYSSYLRGFNDYVPIDTMLTIFGFWLALEFIIFSIKIGLFIFNWFKGHHGEKIN